MNDAEQIRILAVCHYIIGGLTALMACFPVIHLVIGLMIVSGAMDDGRGGAPPAAFGWLFVAFAATFILLGWAFAVALVVAGRCLTRRRGYVFCLVVAALSCGLFPFGTCLGVFTILVLARPGVKAEFARAAGKPASPGWELA